MEHIPALKERLLTQLQERFLQSGFVGLSDTEILQLVYSLFLRSDQAEQLAQLRIRQFKTLRAFLAASPEALERAGATRLGTLIIKFFNELPAEVLRRKLIKRHEYKSSQDMFGYLYYSMRDLNKEVFKVIYLNSRSQIIEVADLGEGTASGIHINPRQIVESAFKYSALGLVFAHNHPTGDPSPSRSDKQLTRDLVFAGDILSIRVTDHIIIGENRYFSFADAGLIQKYEESFLTLRLRALSPF